MNPYCSVFSGFFGLILISVNPLPLFTVNHSQMCCRVNGTNYHEDQIKAKLKKKVI